MSLAQLLRELSSAEISEWMAYDLVSDDEYRKKLESKMMTEEQRNTALIKMLGGK